MTNYVASYVMALSVLACSGAAQAITVATGCATPSTPSEHRSFYVDPVNGSMSNDGSAQHPWKTLAEVVDNKTKLIVKQSHSGNYQNGDRKLYDQNPGAPIKPGDVLNLMNGDHGNVQILGAINGEFIIVRAAPGQAPLLRSLRVDGASKWMFDGLKVQGTGDGSTNSFSGSSLIEFGRSPWLGPSDNIVFTNGSVSTTDDASGWTDLDWVKKPFATGLASSATCATISTNHFYNLRDVMGIDGNNSLIADNNVDNFGNDAIDIVGSDLTIRNNKITNGHHTASEPMHADGIQGWTVKGATNKDVVIEGNTIIKTGDPLLTYLQGISIFDGRWDGLTIANNVVVTNTWNGIVVMGADNVRIVNNTVVAYDPVKFLTMISVRNAKDGSQSQNVIIRNNITPQLSYPVAPTVMVDHNIVAKTIGTSPTSGKATYWSKPGRYGDGNIINPEIYGTVVMVDHLKGTYDLHLKADSPAIGAGNPDLAPATDIAGKRRTVPVDVGAYAH